MRRPATSACLSLASYLVTVSPSPCAAQAPTVYGRVACPSGTCAAPAVQSSDVSIQTPPNSEWLRLGAKLGYKFDGEGEFTDDFLVNGLVQIGNLTFSKDQPDGFRVPLMANFSSLSPDLAKDTLSKKARQIISASPGLQLGVSPFYQTGTKWRTTVYSYAGWKLNAGRDFADTTKTRYLHQGRVAVGIALDASIIDALPNLPISLSIEPVYSFFNKRRYRQIFGPDAAESNLISLELTGVIPVGTGTALLAQTITAEHTSPVWRVGLLFVKGPGNTEKPAPKQSGASGIAATAKIRSTCVGLECTFDGRGSNVRGQLPGVAINQYQWTIDSEKPVAEGTGEHKHVFTAAGKHTVKLRVEGASTADTASITETIDLPAQTTTNPTSPVAAPVDTPATEQLLAPKFTERCTLLECRFEASTPAAGEAAVYTWDFGDGTKMAGKTVTHSYKVAGTYAVTLVAFDKRNRGRPVTRNVSVSAPVPPPR